MIQKQQVTESNLLPTHHLRLRLFGISLEETSFSRRNFHYQEEKVRQHLEEVGRTFLTGYHTALAQTTVTQIGHHLDQHVLPALCGFAFEGAAMALSLLDFFTPWSANRLTTFLQGPGQPHIYMGYVGVGWTWARLRRSVTQLPAHFDPLLGWLAVDGYGFHEGYFHWPRYFVRQTIPRRLKGYARRVFDQGLGRSLWFVRGGDVTSMAALIKTFPLSRQPDLWSGVGLAAAYAGGVQPADLHCLRTAVQHHHPHLAQGAAFAAKARLRAGNPTPHTEAACQIIGSRSAAEMADITDWALDRLSDAGPHPIYEQWRQHIRAEFGEDT